MHDARLCKKTRSTWPDVQSATIDEIRKETYPLPLQQATLSERDRVSAGDDEMIEYSHVYQRQRLLERLLLAPMRF
jgi:hypothetical protein